MYVIFASHPEVGRLCGYSRLYYEQYINQRWKHTKNSLLVLSYQPYKTDIYKILPLWCIRLKTILFQAAYHNYSKLRSRNTTVPGVGLQTLYNRHLQDTATLMYKVKNNLVPSCLSQLFKTKKSQYYCTWCWATDSIQQTSTRYCHSDV